MGTIRDINGNYVGEIDGAEILGKPFLCVYGKTKPRHWDETVIERPVAEGLTAYIRFEASKKVNELVSKDAGASIGGTILAKRHILEQFAIDEAELWEQAEKNTSAELENMNKVIAKMSGLPEEILPDMPLYVLGNKPFSAGILGKEQALKDIYDNVGEFIIIPSSIHELIVVPKSLGIPAEEVQKMVVEVNGTVVAEIDQLSDDVYAYDAEGLHVA